MCPLLKDTFCVTTLCSVAGSKVLPSSFHLNGHILGFHQQTQKLEPPCTDVLNEVNREPQPSKIAISTIKRQKAVITVNFRHCRHSRDRDLVFVLARVRNSGVREKNLRK